MWGGLGNGFGSGLGRGLWVVWEVVFDVVWEVVSLMNTPRRAYQDRGFRLINTTEHYEKRGPSETANQGGTLGCIPRYDV